MPRYLIERELPDGLSIPQDEAGACLCRTPDRKNSQRAYYFSARRTTSTALPR